MLLANQPFVEFFSGNRDIGLVSNVVDRSFFEKLEMSVSDETRPEVSANAGFGVISVQTSRDECPTIQEMMVYLQAKRELIKAAIKTLELPLPKRDVEDSEEID